VRDKLEPSISTQAGGRTHRRTDTHQHDEANNRFSQLRSCAEKLSSFPRVKRSLHYEDQEDDEVQKNGPYLLCESIGTNGATGYGQTADFMNVTAR
jgi:hypothetical protein